jgi:hypothetical protein
VHFVERREGAGKILEGRATDNEIKLLGREGEIGGIALFEIDGQPGLACILCRDAYESAADVEPYQTAAGEPDEFNGEVTGPRRDFENAGAGAEIRRAMPLNSSRSWAV